MDASRFYLFSIRIQRKGAIVRPISTETESLPHHRAIRGQIGAAAQHRALDVVLRLTRIGALREHGNNVPGFELEGFGVEGAEGYGFVEIGSVDSLEPEGTERWLAIVCGADGTSLCVC